MNAEDKDAPANLPEVSWEKKDPAAEYLAGNLGLTPLLIAGLTFELVV